MDSCKILKTFELFTFGKVHIKFPEEQNEIGNAVREVIFDHFDYLVTLIILLESKKYQEFNKTCFLTLVALVKGSSNQFKKIHFDNF